MSGIIASLGDRRARRRFERLTELAMPSLYRAARRLTASQAEAEDLVHDACLKAFEAWQRVELRGPEAHRAWLFRILVNAYRDQYRRRQRAPEIELVGSDRDAETPFVERAPSHEPGPEHLSQRREFIHAVDAAIQTLPSEVRLVVTLFFVEELTYREIAEIADCPVGTVMSRLSRGRSALRIELAAYAPEASPVTTHHARRTRGS